MHLLRTTWIKIPGIAKIGKKTDEVEVKCGTVTWADIM
jgi:hypothetical protein